MIFRKKYSNKQIIKRINELETKLDKLGNLLLNSTYSFCENILKFNNRIDGFRYKSQYNNEILMYLPNFETDYIQSKIFFSHTFYSEDHLKK